MYLITFKSKNLVISNVCSNFATVNKKQIIFISGGNSNSAYRLWHI